mmetsp:Transcript_5493/g.9319  ORF Transcript_5493/g.9319 Transcript_5493/m.9319 type:complete len:86 (-) Transcript_5493:80-337(-)
MEVDAQNLPEYEMAEISKHKSCTDCWLVIEGHVYNVTEYVFDHPGGEDMMVDNTGKDATSDYEDAEHSKKARNLLKKYLIGKLKQ